MTVSRTARIGLVVALVLTLVGAVVVVALGRNGAGRTDVIAFFDNSKGIYEGDNVMIRGVPVGKIDNIEPEPQRVKITFHVDEPYKVPADVNAVIISPTLVTARAIQLTPAYTGGPEMQSGAVIPQQRTAVPVEFDQLRDQLEKLTTALQPTAPGGVSPLGAFVSSAADTLHGEGANIRDMLVNLSQALSALGDHGHDLFGTVKNLSVLVSALHTSTDLLRQLNGNFASVTGLLANDYDEIGNAVKDLDVAVGDVATLVADNREPLGVASERLASISQALVDSLDDLKQTLHVAPTAFQNFANIYEPAQQALTGALSVNSFANPIDFLCGAIQSASRLNMEQSAKLCVQYLAPIVKNRQYNFPPIGLNPFSGPQARPNEVTFSEDWLRPLTEAGRIRDFYEGPLPDTGAHPDTPGSGGPPPAAPPAAVQTAFPAEATPTDPAAGLSGMMMPPGEGS